MRWIISLLVIFVGFIYTSQVPQDRVYIVRKHLNDHSILEREDNGETYIVKRIGYQLGDRVKAVRLGLGIIPSTIYIKQDQ